MKKNIGVVVLWTFATLGLVLVVASAHQVTSAQTFRHYRVIDENNGGKIEQELNNIARSDPTCRPVLAIAANEYGKSKVILECGVP